MLDRTSTMEECLAASRYVESVGKVGGVALVMD
jgi:hypothetical protein